MSGAGRSQSDRLLSQLLGVCGASARETFSPCRELLDRLTDDVMLLSARPTSPSPVQAIEHAMINWRIKPAPKVTDFDLLRVLTHRRGNCVELSSLAILLSRRVGIRAAAVKVPNHMFVRIWHGDTPVNYEPASGGRPLSDAEYGRRFRLTEHRLRSGMFLVPLTDPELLGEVAHKAVFEHLVSGRMIAPQVRRAVRQALRDNPKGAELNNSVGLSYLIRHRYRRAEERFRLSLAVDPDCLGAQNNLAETLISQGRCAEALAATAHADSVAIGEDHPQYPILLWNRGRAHFRLGNYARAESIFRMLDESGRDSAALVPSLSVLPYRACLAYSRRQYARSANISREWALADGGQELGIIWAASAMHRQGCDDVPLDLVTHRDFADEYLTMLARWIADDIPLERVLEEFPQRSAETHCYAGEFLVRKDLPAARRHWREAVIRARVRTFEFLRASRNLLDAAADGETCDKGQPGGATQ